MLLAETPQKRLKLPVTQLNVTPASQVVYRYFCECLLVHFKTFNAIWGPGVGKQNSMFFKTCFNNHLITNKIFLSSSTFSPQSKLFLSVSLSPLLWTKILKTHNTWVSRVNTTVSQTRYFLSLPCIVNIDDSHKTAVLTVIVWNGELNTLPEDYEL